MRSAAAKRNFWIELGIVVLLITLGITAFLRSETKPLNTDELKINVSDMRSFAAGGSQLAEQFVRRDLTETFYKAQTSLVQDKVRSTRKTLDSSEAGPELQSEIQQARELAANLETAYGHLADSPQNAANSKSELAALVVALKQLEESLKRKAEKK